MYIISLWLLFVLIIPLTVSPVSTKELSAVKEWYNLITILVRKNVLPLICLAMALFGLILFKQLEYRWKGTKDLPVQVTNVESENFEYLTFLTTYIIPLVCINLDETRYIVVLLVLLLIIGIIFVQSDFYMGNPTLALMGYRLYRISYKIGEQEYEKMVITKDRIHVGDDLESIPFDQHTWYARRKD